MILREEDGDLFLFRQADHALLSGALAAAWGAPPWDRPAPFESVVVGARLHDISWTPFDEALPCRADGRPYGFTEVNRGISTRLYGRGLDAVEAIDPYAGLLNSLHYSGFYTSHWGWRHWAPNSGLEGDEKEAVDRFVDAEKGRQRRLRDRLGIGKPEERQLMCNYFWLQLWDRVSLDVCRHGFAGRTDVYPETPAAYAPGAPGVQLRLSLEPGGVCRLEPYPLVPGEWRSRVACVRIAGGVWNDPGGLSRAWIAGGAESIEVTFRPF